jgi:DNA invertase Pin-like site-specific DNA recombinase
MDHAVKNGLIVGHTKGVIYANKLTTQKVDVIRRMCRQREKTHKDIARLFGVHKKTIDNISANITWRSYSTPDIS